MSGKKSIEETIEFMILSQSSVFLNDSLFKCNITM